MNLKRITATGVMTASLLGAAFGVLLLHLGLPLLEVGAHLGDLPLDRGPGVRPPCARRPFGLRGGLVELIAFTIDGGLKLVAACLQLRTILFPNGGRRILQPLDPAGQIHQ